MPDTGPNYSLPAGYFVQPGDTILPSQHNPIFEDVAAAMNARMLRNGTSPMTGNLQMGSKQITGLAAASQPHHAPRFDQITPKTAWLTSVSGLSLAANEMVYASGTNTAAKTALTAFARTLLEASGPVAARDVLDVPGRGREVAAGPGLVGGGDFSANRSISLGTPSSITHDSTNSRSETSHTHALSAATVGILTGQLGVGAVGQYAFAEQTTGARSEWGSTRAGSNLAPAGYSNGSGATSGLGNMQGTWRCHGFIEGGGTTRVTLWQRIV